MGNSVHQPGWILAVDMIWSAKAVTFPNHVVGLYLHTCTSVGGAPEAKGRRRKAQGPPGPLAPGAGQGTTRPFGMVKSSSSERTRFSAPSLSRNPARRMLSRRLGSAGAALSGQALAGYCLSAMALHRCLPVAEDGEKHPQHQDASGDEQDVAGQLEKADGGSDLRAPGRADQQDGADAGRRAEKRQEE
jgi:hypothetical protein